MSKKPIEIGSGNTFSAGMIGFMLACATG